MPPQTTSRTTANDVQSGLPSRLRELATLFLRLGVTSFGGPVAHVAMMEDEIVNRRGWLTREDFLDLVGATNLIPGPNSTELAIHVGRLRAGWRGLLVAGVSFIMPAATLVGLLAWVYVHFGSLPSMTGLLHGMKPVVLAIVLQALYRLGRTAIKTPLLAGIAVVSIVGIVAGVDELLLLLIAGLAHAAATSGSEWKNQSVRMAAFTSLATQVGGAAPFSSYTMFLAFAKVGAVLFGSGYVLIALLRAEFVERLGWITETQLFDAIAIGQATPGPVFTAATFIGYVLGGAGGAMLATIGIFLPAFIFVAVSSALLPSLRASPRFRAGLAGVNVASLALMAVVTWKMGRAAIDDVPTAGLALVSAGLLFRFRLNSVWLVLGGAAAGLLMMR